MPTQRIVLVNGSRLLRGILKRAIEQDNSLYVVAEVDNHAKIPSVMKEVNTDWILLVLHPKDPFPGTVDNLLRNRPKLKCLVMSSDGSQVQMRWIETHDTPLNEKSLDEILSILREPDDTERTKERKEI